MRFWDWLRKVFPWWVRHYNRLEIRGVEHLPRTGSAIIAPNHSGGFDLDNFTLMSALEQFRTDNPARKHIWLCYHDKWAVDAPLWAPWVQKFSPIPINLDGKGLPYHLIDKIVARGELLAIYPEGHSASVKEGYRLWKFYPGVARLHLRYKIPIIPTVNIGFLRAIPVLGQQYAPGKVPPWEKEIMTPLYLPRKTIIHFGSPVSFPEYFGKEPSREDLYAIARAVRRCVRAGIRRYYPEASPAIPRGRKNRSAFHR